MSKNLNDASKTQGCFWRALLAKRRVVSIAGSIPVVGAKLFLTQIANRRTVCALVIALLFFAPAATTGRSDTLTLPFHTADSMILFEARVNDNRVTLLLDTGANNTIISPKAYGYSQFRLRSIHNNEQGPGMKGDVVRLRADLVLANRTWVSQPLSVMNVDELTQRFGTPVDGLLGQDILREFHSVRINYKAHIIELEP